MDGMGWDERATLGGDREGANRKEFVPNVRVRAGKAILYKKRL